MKHIFEGGNSLELTDFIRNTEQAIEMSSNTLNTWLQRVLTLFYEVVFFDFRFKNYSFSLDQSKHAKLYPVIILISTIRLKLFIIL